MPHGEARQFAIERIKTLHTTDEHFVPDAAVNVARHADSLGVHLGGKPETVTIEFQPEAAPYVAEREYHPSQSLELREDGCLVLKMRVSVDFALGAWVLGFGPRARVLAPRRLAQVILEQIEDMRANYAPMLPGLAQTRSGRPQKGLPFTTKAR